MNAVIRDFPRALRAERLKLKGTLVFWLALVAPAVIVTLQVLMAYVRREYYYSRPPSDAWIEYNVQIMIMWSLLMMPLFVTLETALVAQLDHANQGWKHLFALPVARGTLYAAKQISGMALIGLSLVTLTALTLAGGLALRVLTPELGFEATAPVGEVVEFATLVFLGSWLVISIQTWIAQRWSSFVVASAVGVAMTIVGVMVIQSDYAGYYPYTLPVLIANGFSDTIRPLNVLDEGVRPVKELLVGSLGGVIAAFLAGWHVTRRDVL
jgi:hypothetical protein